MVHSKKTFSLIIWGEISKTPKKEGKEKYIEEALLAKRKGVCGESGTRNWKLRRREKAPCRMGILTGSGPSESRKERKER